MGSCGMADDPSPIACPYCQVKLKQLSYPDGKCRHCGQHIVVRRGRPMTEDEYRIETWLARLIQFNITRSDFDSCRLELSQRHGSTASVDDTVWRILKAQVSRGRDLDLVYRAYEEMARLASEEEQDPRPYLAKAQAAASKQELWRRGATFRRDMREIRARPSVEFVEVQTCKDELVCPACKLLASELYRVNEAPELPCEECQSEGGCRCSIAAVPWKSRDVRFWWIRFARRVDRSLALTIVHAWWRSWRMRAARWWAERHTRL